MSTFYKMDPAAWDFGTADLTLEEEAAYLRIINAIHKHDGPVPNNDRVLAGLFRVSTRRARQLLQALLNAEKVHIEDGKIWNERARSDLVRRGFEHNSRVERGAKGGRTKAERAAKPLENNEPYLAAASARIEKRREEDSVANATGGEPPKGEADSPVDLAKALFDAGVPYLVKHGTKPPQARALLAKWRQEHGDGPVLEALAISQTQAASDPVPFITATLRRRNDRTRTAQSAGYANGGASREDGFAAHIGRSVEKARRGEIWFGDDGAP